MEEKDGEWTLRRGLYRTTRGLLVPTTQDWLVCQVWVSMAKFSAMHKSSLKVTWDSNAFSQTITAPQAIIKGQLDELSIYFFKDWELHTPFKAALEIYSEHILTKWSYWAWEGNSSHYDFSWQSHCHGRLEMTLRDLITKYLSSAILHFPPLMPLKILFTMKQPHDMLFIIILVLLWILLSL